MNSEHIATTESSTNWTQVAIDACDGMTGSVVVELLTKSVLDRLAESALSGEPSNNPEVISELIATVLGDIAGLAWHTRETGLPLDQHYRLQGLDD